MSDWYANRLAQARGQQPSRPMVPQPVAPMYQPQPQIIGYLPDGTPIYSAPPQGQHVHPQQFHQPNPAPLNEQDLIQAALKKDSGVTPMDVLNMVGAKGGKGTKTETELCPQCGSNQYFTRRALGKNTVHGRVPPAPLCHTCGYNGMFEQYGTQEPAE